MNYGIFRNKTFTTSIPENLLSWDKSRFVIKGIFETDGSLYFSKSKTSCIHPSYPRLEIKTVSSKLAQQLYIILNKNYFKAKIRKNGSTWVIYLSGEDMLNKWVTEVGFGSKKNVSKLLLWRKLGYYIPKLTLPGRIALISRKATKTI